MDIDGKIFILLIILFSSAGWLINNWIRAKHGYALEDEFGGFTERSDTAETSRLKAENRELHDKIDAMQDRMIVLERIVTDRGYSLSEEIEALRDTPARHTPTKSADTGVPLDLAKKEQQS